MYKWMTDDGVAILTYFSLAKQTQLVNFGLSKRANFRSCRQEAKLWSKDSVFQTIEAQTFYLTDDIYNPSVVMLQPKGISSVDQHKETSLLCLFNWYFILFELWKEHIYYQDVHCLQAELRLNLLTFRQIIRLIFFYLLSVSDLVSQFEGSNKRFYRILWNNSRRIGCVIYETKDLGFQGWKSIFKALLLASNC